MVRQCFAIKNSDCTIQRIFLANSQKILRNFRENSHLEWIFWGIFYISHPTSWMVLMCHDKVQWYLRICHTSYRSVRNSKFRRFFRQISTNFPWTFVQNFHLRKGKVTFLRIFWDLSRNHCESMSTIRVAHAVTVTFWNSNLMNFRSIKCYRRMIWEFSYQKCAYIFFFNLLQSLSHSHK